MKPEVRLELIQRDLAPGAELAGAFVIPGGVPPETTSVEFSVLWHTSGKGTEDLGVVYYQSWREGSTLAEMPNPYSFVVRLPQTPHSYDGELIKIHWLARLRIRYGESEELIEDCPFSLRPSQS